MECPLCDLTFRTRKELAKHLMCKHYRNSVNGYKLAALGSCLYCWCGAKIRLSCSDGVSEFAKHLRKPGGSHTYSGDTRTPDRNPAAVERQKLASVAPRAPFARPDGVSPVPRKTISDPRRQLVIQDTDTGLFAWLTGLSSWRWVTRWEDATIWVSDAGARHARAVCLAASHPNTVLVDVENSVAVQP